MEADDLLRAAVDLCERLGVSYLVTGSTATIAYGEPRFTNDIDIVIDLKPGQVDSFCDAFPMGEYYLNRDTVREGVRTQSQFNLIHPGSGLKIDFIVLSKSEFDRSRIARARRLPALSERDVTFASPEDVILKKMIYYLEGESQKHLRDIGGVLRVQGATIDRAYIAEWARRLGVADIWQSVLDREAETDQP